MKKVGPLHLINAILCEDVRTEAGSGKHMLIGVFSGDIMVSELPATLLLAFYLEFEMPAGSFDLELRLSGPGKGVAKLSGRIEQAKAGTAALVYSKSGILMEQPGVFRIDARVPGGRWVNLIKKGIILRDQSTAAPSSSTQSALEA